MATNLAVAECVYCSKGLPLLPSSPHAAVRTHCSEPLKVWVLHDVHCARSDKASKHVVVEGELVHVANVGVEVRAEPDVFADDLLGALDIGAVVVLPVLDSPTPGTAGPGFLREGEGDTGLEGSGDHCTFPISGAASYAQAGRVDASLRLDLFESIDDATNAPGPGGESPSRVAASVEVVEFALPTRAGVGLLGDIVVAEGDAGDIVGDRDTGTVAAKVYDCWEGAGAGRFADGNREGYRVSVFSHADG